MLKIDILFILSIKDCMFNTSIIENSKELSSAKFDSAWAHSWAWRSLIVGVGWSSTSVHSIGSSIKSKSKWISLLEGKSTYCTMFYRYQQFLLCQLHVFIETCQFICCFFHFEISMFIIHSKSSPQSASKILDILYLFCMIWGFIALHTWEHHIITCLKLGVGFLKSKWAV